MSASWRDDGYVLQVLKVPDSAIVVDTEQYPMVRMTAPNDYTVEDVEQLVGTFIELAAHGRFGLIVDLSALKKTNAVRRRRVHQLCQEFYRGPGRGKLIVEALVVPSALARSMVTAYHWFVPPQDRVSRAFVTLERAGEWCHAELQELLDG